MSLSFQNVTLEDAIKAKPKSSIVFVAPTPLKGGSGSVYEIGQWIPLPNWQQILEVSGAYIIRNTLDGKEYVGISKHVRTRLGIHISNNKKSQYLHHAFKKWGLDKFEVCIHLTDTIENLPELEILLIEERKCKAPLGYNLTFGGDGVWGMVSSEETKQKLRLANLGKKQSKETCNKRSLSMLGMVRSPESVAKSTAAKIGVKRSPETVEKMRIAATGRPVSDETRRRLGLASLGREVSPETREKIRVANTGKVHNAETRLKIGLVQLGRKASEETKQRMKESAIRIKSRFEKPVFLWEEGSMCPRLFNSASDLASYLGTCLANVSKWALGGGLPRNFNIAVAYA